ncbi:MAG: hypothetical protein NPINA01_32090 [Nitrospinaceae bacterium]|jgi:hypothetical protein|nr:MAG: hypothetical protein NPINA01_32090 [Nitrospinaceae bacterium]
MTFNQDKVRTHLKTANFQKLFIEELGWDNPSTDQEITVDGETMPLKAVAQKRGLAVFKCDFLNNGKIPDSNFRRKIDNQLTKYVREHLIIFVSENNDRQEWQWVRREPGQTSALRTASFNQSQSGEVLIQKLRGLYFSLDEEEKLTLVDATSRVRAAFDVERVTKRFYDLFKKKHDKFLSFIKGIPDDEFQRWYASVMLNRIMFIYFLQKKNFLDNDPNYLRTRLNLVKEKKKGGYYKTFLCPLFFEGFAKKEKNRPKEFRDLLGKIPYLNGGLFLKHQLEDLYGDKIDIPDKAFEDLFEFFDQYQWHLDERPLRQDNEINPDVLGYIFEKYINQKQMGAYYTKEDITDYISKNTIIPWLFNTASKKCEIAFDKGSYLWNLLQSNPDKYIFSAVRHGCDLELPSNISKGLADVSKRTDWNKSAPPEYALPTEIWREVVARRHRHEETKSAITNGEIQSIEDFITFNLDIRQFARDVIDGAEGPELVRAFWKAINEITVLDPACGSGAFLFAALNILEDLYEACLERMQGFVNDLDSNGSRKVAKLKDFRDILERISSHPNEKYFVYKSIIIKNLFGVDIMEEATEICKLRLFLKLAAQLESPDHIEPLPDIDFNIKAGNSLIGYTSETDIKRSKTFQNADEQLGFEFDDRLEQIKNKSEDLDSAFVGFRKQQTDIGGEITLKHKEDLKARLYDLEEELNTYLCQDYGIDPDIQSSYKNWKASHKPFHWWLEFYGIMNNGGFNACIGNPPYVEYSKVKGDYTLKGFKLIGTGNLYSIFIEKFNSVLEKNGLCGIIVPISSVSTPRMEPLMKFMDQGFSLLFASNYAVRPDKLFVGVDMNLTIFIGKKGKQSNNQIFSTKYTRWFSEFRPYLFQSLVFSKTHFLKSGESVAILKLGNQLELGIIEKIMSFQNIGLIEQRSGGSEVIYYHSGGRYFRKAIKKKLSNEYKELSLKENWGDPLICVLSSSLYYFLWLVTSDTYHVTKGDIHILTIPETLKEDRKIPRLSKRLLDDLWSNAETRNRNRADGSQQQEVNFKVGKSKAIIDEIDHILGKHYGLKEEELDFIINYDIKYRLGPSEIEKS